MPTDRAILHVDMDAFYASVEMQDDPTLRGRPLIVGGTSGRGVVAAASYEVRRYGVHSAMPMRRALQLCPHAVCVQPRMRRYQEVSRQVFAIFHEFTPLVAGLSLDEAFLDVTHSLSLKGDAVSIARSIKGLIRERTGLTASVGIAPNRLVAKIASDLDKPDGLTLVTHASLQAVLDPLPVRRLPGLGRKQGRALVTAGIGTLGELRRASDARLWPLCGRESARLRERAAGIDESVVTPEREERSISAEETFFTDIADPLRLRSEVLGCRIAPRLACAASSCAPAASRSRSVSTISSPRPGKAGSRRTATNRGIWAMSRSRCSTAGCSRMRGHASACSVWARAICNRWNSRTCSPASRRRSPRRWMQSSIAFAAASAAMPLPAPAGLDPDGRNPLSRRMRTSAAVVR